LALRLPFDIAAQSREHFRTAHDAVGTPLAAGPACTDIDSAGDGLRAFELGRHSGDQEQEIVNAPKGLHIWLARDM
jgi:hypothetical protein